MSFLVDLLSNPSLKRAVVGGIAAAIIALNRKLGLGLETPDVASIVALAVAFLTQSALKEVHLAGIDAAGKVKTVDDAIKLFNAEGNVTVKAP